MSDKQIKILKNIRKYKKLGVILEKSGFSIDEYLDFQECFSDGSYRYMVFGDLNYNHDTPINLTDYAESFLDERKRKNLQNGIAVIIAVLTLIATIVTAIR